MEVYILAAIVVLIELNRLFASSNSKCLGVRYTALVTTSHVPSLGSHSHCIVHET